MTSLSACIMEYLRAEPGRIFLVGDLVDLTGAKPEAVRQVLSRLSKIGKGSGSIIRVARGLYRYDPLIEHANLKALVRTGNWKIENLTFVTKRAQGEVLSQAHTIENSSNYDENYSPSGAISRTDFPWDLPTGQKVFWEKYSNGTQVIRFSANGNSPFSPDHALTLIHNLKMKGFEGNNWHCVSLECNLDSRKLRIDASYSIQVIEGLLLKVYQHGPTARLEIADRRKCSTKEVLELLNGFAGGCDGSEALKKVHEVTERLERCEKSSRLAYKVATKMRNCEKSAR